MALPSKRIVIKDAWVPLGAVRQGSRTKVRTLGLNTSSWREAGSMRQRGVRTGLWVCSLHALSKSIIINNNYMITTTPATYSVLHMPLLEGGGCNYLHFTDKIKKLRIGGQVTCLEHAEIKFRPSFIQHQSQDSQPPLYSALF